MANGIGGSDFYAFPEFREFEGEFVSAVDFAIIVVKEDAEEDSDLDGFGDDGGDGSTFCAHGLEPALDAED